MEAGILALVTLLSLCTYSTVLAADSGEPSYELEIGLIGTSLEGVTLGDDISLDQLDTDEITMQFDLE